LLEHDLREHNLRELEKFNNAYSTLPPDTAKAIDNVVEKAYEE